VNANRRQRALLAVHLRGVDVEQSLQPVIPCAFGKRLVLGADAREFLFRQFFEIEERVVSALHGADQFVQLQLHGGAVSVLGVLDEEDHEKGDDGRPGVDDELPSVAVVEERAADRPDHDNTESQQERRTSAREMGCLGREIAKEGRSAFVARTKRGYGQIPTHSQVHPMDVTEQRRWNVR
jgi:hypothetical protein